MQLLLEVPEVLLEELCILLAGSCDFGSGTVESGDLGLGLLGIPQKDSFLVLHLLAQLIDLGKPFCFLCC